MSGRPNRLSGPVFLIGTAVLVTLVGLLAALVTWAFHQKPKPPCTLNCPPPQQPAFVHASSAFMNEQQTYASQSFGFHADYPSSWKLQKSDGDTLLFQTHYGQFQLTAMRSAPSALQLIQQQIGKLHSSQLPDIEDLGTIHGAHIGSVEGTGELYSATFTPSAGQSLLVRIGIVVARRGNSTMMATALVPYDERAGRILGDDIDYAMAEFRWQGE